MPNVSIYLSAEMYLKLQKDGDMSKTVQEALTLLWTTRDKEKKINKTEVK